MGCLARDEGECNTRGPMMTEQVSLSPCACENLRRFSRQEAQCLPPPPPRPPKIPFGKHQKCPKGCKIVCRYPKRAKKQKITTSRALLYAISLITHTIAPCASRVRARSSTIRMMLPPRVVRPLAMHFRHQNNNPPSEQCDRRCCSTVPDTPNNQGNWSSSRLEISCLENGCCVLP